MEEEDQQVDEQQVERQEEDQQAEEEDASSVETATLPEAVAEAQEYQAEGLGKTAAFQEVDVHGHQGEVQEEVQEQVDAEGEENEGAGGMAAMLEVEAIDELPELLLCCEPGGVWLC